MNFCCTLLRVVFSTTTRYCLLFLFLLSGTLAEAQSISQLESSLKKSVGYERLDILNRISDHYIQSQDRKAIRYSKMGVSLAENLFRDNPTDVRNIQTRLLFAEANYSRGKYYTAQEELKALRSITSSKLHPKEQRIIDDYLQKLDSIAADGGVQQGFLSKTIGNIDVGGAISDASSDLVISNYLKQAERAVDNGDFQEAIELYEKAIFELEKKGDLFRLEEVYRNTGSAYKMFGNDEKADEYYAKASGEVFTDSVATGRSRTQKIIDRSDSLIANLQPTPDTLRHPQDSMSSTPALESLSQPELLASDIQRLSTKEDQLEEFARQAEERQDYKTLAMLEKELSDLRDAKSDLEIREREYALLVSEKAREVESQARLLEEEENVRIRLLFGSGALSIFLLSMAFLYFSKRKDHKKLTVAYSNLDEAKNELSDAQEKIKTLLNQQVSGDIAEALIESSDDKHSERKFVCIMFLDIRNFTPFAEKLAPEELIDFQNNIFGFMIDIIVKNHGNINQFMGDGFMATFGAPVSHGNDVDNAYRSAVEILDRIRKEGERGTIPETKIGIGLHAGHVVAGNVGTDLRKQYSITGNTVITAARLEQLNKDFDSSLVISEAVYNRIESRPKGEFRSVRVKGRKKPMNVLALG